MFTFQNVMFAILTVSVLFILWRIFLGPAIGSWLTKLRDETVDQHCPLQLVRVLWTYRKENGELDVPAEVMKFLQLYFSRDIICHATDAVRYGKIDIYIDSWNTGGLHGKIRYKYLAAGFDKGELAYAYFHEPRGGGKTGL
ncbi:MAG: hypothetical protein WBL19_00820 [Minisyncoccia bacterium]